MVHVIISADSGQDHRQEFLIVEAIVEGQFGDIFIPQVVGRHKIVDPVVDIAIFAVAFFEVAISLTDSQYAWFGISLNLNVDSGRTAIIALIGGNFHSE